MDIRKVLAGSLAALTAGAAMAFGIFASSLGDYVVVSDSRLSSPIIAVGDTAAVSDVVSAIDVGVAVAGFATTEQTVGGAAVTSVTGGAQLTSDLNKTYIGADFSTVKDTLTNTDLPTLLATQTFTDKNATTITYTQQIKPTTQDVSFGRPTGETDQVLYVTFDSSNKYNLTIYFLGGLDTSAVDSNYGLTLFGNDYTFGATEATGQYLELFTSAGAQTLTLNGAGDEKTVTIDGTDYTFKLTGWSAGGSADGDEIAYLLVNGAATSPPGWQENNYYTLPGTTTKVFVKSVSIIYTGAQEATGQVQLFVGADKLEFIGSSNTVEKNDVALPNVNVYFSNSSAKINSLTLTVAPDIATYLIDGGEFVDPVFGFKWVLDGMTPSFTSSDRDLIKFEEDGTDKVKLTFTNKDGTQYVIDIATYDSGWENTVDGTYNLETREANASTDNSTALTIGDYFVLTNSGEKASYIYKYVTYGVSTTDSLRYVTVQDVATGTSQKVYYNSDPYIRIGANSFLVDMIDYGGNYSIAVDLDGNGVLDNTTTVNIYTKGEAVIDLNTDGISGTSFVPTVTESPKYTVGNDPTGEVLGINITYDTSNYVEFNPTGNITQYGGQKSGTKLYKYITDYGTYITRDDTTDVVEIYNPGIRPAYANVAVGPAPEFTTTTGATTVDVAVRITSPVAKLASEVDTSALTSDLILVGGPCVNTLVATLMEADNVTCDTWNYTTGIIKEYANAFGSGQKALVIAGTLAEDTRALAAKVMEGILSFEE